MQRGLKTAGLLKVLLCAGGCAHSPPAIRSLVEWPKPPSEQPVGVEASGRIQTASFRHSKASLPLDSPDATFNSLDEGGMVEDRSVPVRRNANKNDFNAHLPDLQPDSTTRPLKLEPQASGLHSGPTSDVAEEMASENAVVSPQEVIAVDLQSALSMIGGQQPEVGFARWRVQEAYAEYRQARVLWLPTIQTGFSFHRHDGNYQASNGDIVDVNRNSFQYGLGNGATGAGTTQRPGVVAQFHLTAALFQPAVTQKRAWAAQHTSDAVLNQQLLEAALAYLELLEAYQRRSIVQQTFERTADLAKLTDDFAATGQGLQADADRLATERLMAENRLVAAAEQIDVASARLSEVLSLAYGRTIVPAEPSIVPISFVTPEQDQSTLITTGLTNRPELKSSQALVVAACHAYEREKYAPFIPSVLLGFSTGEFGGGLGNELNDVEGRYDFDAALT